MTPRTPSPPWWKRSVAYQIYPRSFCDSDGDGMGDIPGIIQKLDYLASLGVDLLWITPIYASPDFDNGYDISDYQAIQPRFGRMDDVDALIAQAHQRGMRIIMDLVVNHSSHLHPWFVQSRQSKDNPYRDFYIWRDGRDGQEPNNWRAHFSKSAWTLDPATGQYYLHTFSPYQPDLNWQSPQLRAAVHAMVAWWLDKGIDGFRLDAISFISKAPGLPDHAGGAPYTFDLKNMLHGPEYHAYLHELQQKVFSRFDVVAVGECVDLTVDTAIEVAAPQRQELDMPFLFEHTNAAQTHGLVPAELKEILTRWQTGLHGKAWVGLGFNNHDMPRVVSLFGNDGPHREASAKLYGTLLLTLEGTPFIYQGEEIGMTNVAYPSIDDYQDIATLSRYRQRVDEQGVDPASALQEAHATSRDNARTPMQWTSGPQAGFSSAAPWLRVNPNHATINVAQALAEPGSIWHHYRQLIALRKATPALVLGAFAALETGVDAVFAYTRSLDGDCLLVVLNLGASPALFTLPAAYANAQLLLANYAGNTVGLRSFEARIYRV